MSARSIAFFGPARRAALALGAPSGPGTALAVGIPQQTDQHRPECPILLAVDQKLGEGATLRELKNSPIRSARSKSESIRTWRSSAREPDRGRRGAPLTVARADRGATDRRLRRSPFRPELDRMAPDQRRRPSRPRGFRCPGGTGTCMSRGTPCHSRLPIPVGIFFAARLTSRFRRTSAFARSRSANALRECLITHPRDSRSSCRRPSSSRSRSANALRGCLITRFPPADRFR
jgi:hypothetical protein